MLIKIRFYLKKPTPTLNITRLNATKLMSIIHTILKSFFDENFIGLKVMVIKRVSD